MKNAFFFISIFFFTATGCNTAVAINDSDKILLFFSRADSLAVMHNLEKGDFYKYKSADSALHYYNIAAQLTADKLGRITTDSIYGASEEALLKLLHAKSQLKTGLAYNVRAMYSNAVRSLTQSQLLLEELQHSQHETFATLASKELSACYINLGQVYQFLESSDIAGELIQRAIETKLASGDTISIENYYIEAANYYLSEAEEAPSETDSRKWLKQAEYYLIKAETAMNDTLSNRSQLKFRLATVRSLMLEKSFELAEKQLLRVPLKSYPKQMSLPF